MDVEYVSLLYRVDAMYMEFEIMFVHEEITNII